jgi:hypothetical protein
MLSAAHNRTCATHKDSASDTAAARDALVSRQRAVVCHHSHLNVETVGTRFLHGQAKVQSVACVVLRWVRQR